MSKCHDRSATTTPVPEISLPRDDGLTILAALDDAIDLAHTTAYFSLVITLEGAASIRGRLLFPDLPEGNGT